MGIIKRLFLGLLLFIVSETTYGQTTKYNIGIEGGPSLCFLRGNELIDGQQEYLMGFSGGLVFQYNLEKIISFRTNIAFERKSSVLKSELRDEVATLIREISTNTNFNYMTLPLLVRASFGGKTQFFVNAGPYFGYLIKQTSERKLGDISSRAEDTTTLYRRLDTGISTGLGISVPIKTKFLFSMELRNNLGLYNVSSVPVFNQGSVKTNSTSFLLGFSYKM